MVGEPLVIIDSAAFSVVLKINKKSLIFSFMSDVLFPVVNESLLDSVGEDEVDDSDYVNDVNLINPDDYTYVFTFKVNGINPSQARDGYEKNMKRYVKFVNLLKRELDNFTDIYEFSNIVFYSYNGDSLDDEKSRTIHTYDNTVNVYSSDVYYSGYRIGDYHNYKNPDLRGGFAYDRIIGFKFGVIKDYQFTNIPQIFRFFTRLFDIVKFALKNVWPKAVLSVFHEDNLKMYFSYEDIENFKKRDVKVLNKLIKPFRTLTGKNLKNQLIMYMNYYAGNNISDNMLTLIKRLKLENKRFKYNIDYENKLFVVDYDSDNRSDYYICNLNKLKTYVEEAMFKETGVHGFGVKMNNFPNVKSKDMNRLDDIKEFCNIFGTDFRNVYFYFNECAFKNISMPNNIDTRISAYYVLLSVKCTPDSIVRRLNLPSFTYKNKIVNEVESKRIYINLK